MAFSNRQQVKLIRDVRVGQWPLDQGARGIFMKLYPSRPDQAYVLFELYGRELMVPIDSLSAV